MITAEPILSSHKTRFQARRRERELQRQLDNADYANIKDQYTRRTLRENPQVRGVKVEKAGRFNFVVRGTINRGH